MKDMVNAEVTNCPFEFNFDAATFRVGDVVSYRVPEAFDDMPFVGVLVEVHHDHVMLQHYGEPGAKAVRGSREDRPAVSQADALTD